MTGRLAILALLAFAILMPPRQAAAQDAIGGAIVGGAAGAILGGAIGGGRGAAVDAILGAGTGAAIAAEGERRGGDHLLPEPPFPPPGGRPHRPGLPAHLHRGPPPH